jgi:hypothetical protein
MTDMASGTDTTEIRVEAPNDMAAMLDCFARGRRMTRNQLILKLLHDYVDMECHVHSVTEAAALRHPLVAEKIGKGRA